jgi:hypothetical protein
MAHLKFECGGYKFAAIPETGCWFNGGEIDKSSNGKDDPTCYNINGLEVFHVLGYLMCEISEKS